MKKKKSFFERLTGGIKMEDEIEEENTPSSGSIKNLKINSKHSSDHQNYLDEKNEEELDEDEKDSDAELTIDVYQTHTEIIVQTMVAGVHPDNLSITITRDMITLRGKREENQSIKEEDYFIQELYWGSFSRSISLPEEVDPEEAEAIEKHGLLIIRLPKINKHKETKLKIKSI